MSGLASGLVGGLVGLTEQNRPLGSLLSSFFLFSFYSLFNSILNSNLF
jgi:hypothetical protein